MKTTLGAEVSLVAKFDDGLWPARLDPGELENAMLNLSINARDAMPKGGTMTLEAFNVSLKAPSIPKGSDGVPGDYIRICVRDGGTRM